MKTLFKKIVIALCVCMLVCGVIDTTSFQAATLKSYTVDSSSKFNNDWEEKIVYYSNGSAIGRMVYGYDTFMVKEDYTWTMAYQCYSTAKVKRQYVDTSAHNGTQTGKNQYSTIEVVHQSYCVTYGISFSVDYNNVTQDAPVTSNIK